jgi:hypothetical protein
VSQDYVYVETKMNFEELAESIAHSFGLSSSLEHKDIVYLFSRVDDLIGDWDFTRAVAAHFNEEMKNAPKETEE